MTNWQNPDVIPDAFDDRYEPDDDPSIVRLVDNIPTAPHPSDLDHDEPAHVHEFEPFALQDEPGRPFYEGWRCSCGEQGYAVNE